MCVCVCVCDCVVVFYDIWERSVIYYMNTACLIQ